MPNRIVFSYQARTAALRDRLETFITTQWNSLDNYRDDDITQFAETVAPIVTGAQRQLAVTTDSYLAEYETAVTGTQTRPVGVPKTLTTDVELRGVDTIDVYQRGGPTVWTALSEGATLTDAITRGLARMVNTAATDIQLAKTHTARHILNEKSNVTGYRRVIEGPASCGLCIVASTQRYHTADLMPIHAGCDCGVAPIYGNHDPGQIIDPDRLDNVHRTISERFGIDADKSAGHYQDLLIVHEHGELGPVLTVRGQHFTSPAQI